MASSQKKSRAMSVPKKSVSDPKQEDFERESGVYKKAPKSADSKPEPDSKSSKVPVRSGKKPKPAPKAKPKSKTEPVFDPNCAINPVGWERLLRVLKREGGYKTGIGNVQLILTNHPMWKGLFAYDEFIGDIVTTRPVKWPDDLKPLTVETNEWTEEDMGRLHIWLDRFYGIDIAPKTIAEVVRVLSRQQVRHLVREELVQLKWDGTDRCETWMIRLCGAKDTALNRAISARFLIGAVARIMEPGCKHDCMPVFEGKTGIGKSTVCKILFGDYFSDTHFEIGSKDGYQGLRRIWGYEFGELSQLDKGEMTKIKNFLSSPTDRYRPSYGHSVTNFKRQAVFVGTTEDDKWHKDDRGGRRFWPVRFYGVGPTHEIDTRGLIKERGQLWAEALVRYTRKEPWYLDTPELRDMAAVEIDLRRQQHPWEEDLGLQLAENEALWVSFLGEKTKQKPQYPRYSEAGISTSEALDLLQVDGTARTAHAAVLVGTALRITGWTRVDRGAKLFPRYKYYPKDEAAKLERGGPKEGGLGTSPGTPISGKNGSNTQVPGVLGGSVKVPRRQPNERGKVVPLRS